MCCGTKAQKMYGGNAICFSFNQGTVIRVNSDLSCKLFEREARMNAAVMDALF